MRALCATVVAALSAGGAAAFAAVPAPVTMPAPVVRVADPAAVDDKAPAKTDTASPATTENSGKLEVQPPPQPRQPPQPPTLNVPSPPAPPSPPGQAAPQGTPPSERFERHQEPAPVGTDPDKLPRGEGAAMIPTERPSAIKAFEDWVASWFE